MKAVYFEQYRGRIQVKQVPDPNVVDHGVILKVKASGICRSDWHGWMGHDSDITLPHVPGHELCGEIVEVGSAVRSWRVGQRVTVPFVGGCGHCEYCQQGDHQVCPNQFQPGFTHWGSFAEFVSIHYADTNLIQVPDGVSDEVAASLGCRFGTSYRAVMDQGELKEGEWVAVFGCGGVGLSAIMIAKSMYARVIAIDISDEKLQLAKSLGVDKVINSKSVKNLPTQILELTQGGVHIGLDALGLQQIIQDSIMSLRRRGKHIQVGILDPAHSLTPIAMDRIIAYELEIKGSHGMQAHRYGELLDKIEKGILRPEALIKNRVSLEESVDILRGMGQSETLGVQVITQF